MPPMLLLILKRGGVKSVYLRSVVMAALFRETSFHLLGNYSGFALQVILAASPAV